MISWVIAIVTAVTAVIALSLTAMEDPVAGLVVALLVSVPLWVLYWLTGRAVRRDEEEK